MQRSKKSDPNGATPELPSLLVVDDDAATCEILTEGLRSAGYSCAFASNAAQAKVMLQMGVYQMVLSDIDMPGENGIELAGAIKSLDPDIDVVMVTGSMDVGMAVKSIRKGASDYLTKPFNLDEVKIVIERTWEKRRLIRENRAYQLNLEVKVAERTKELRTAYQAIEETYQDTLEALIQALDMRDTETQGHSLRVVEYTLEIARSMGVTDPRLTEIGRGALLHDIGKIGIPDSILKKPGKLDEREWEVMRTHPELGFNMLAGIKFLEHPREVVLSHQEKWDGTGYPRHLKGEAITLGARIFSVADTFDAMTSTRPYRTGLPYERARQELIDFSGTQFDPDVVRSFLAVSKERWNEIRDDVKRRIRESESKIAALNLVFPPALVND